MSLVLTSLLGQILYLEHNHSCYPLIHIIYANTQFDGHHFYKGRGPLISFINCKSNRLPGKSFTTSQAFSIAVTTSVTETQIQVGKVSYIYYKLCNICIKCGLTMNFALFIIAIYRVSSRTVPAPYKHFISPVFLR